MTAILVNSTYQPARGGHAPGDVRDAFLEAVNCYAQWDDGEPEPTVEVRGRAVSLSTVCGLLWNCSDIVPRLTIDELCFAAPWPECDNCRQGMTYAQAARLLKQMVEQVSRCAA